MQAPSRLNETFLDEMRTIGDPEADAVIDSIVANHDLREVQKLVGQLMANNDPVPEELPEVVRNYFETTGEVDPSELPGDRLGELFFATHGPEIMLVLCCYSLPIDYANHRAVGVLYQTGYLAKRPNRRVAETAQMIIDVMAPGGLSPRGKGIRSAQKVRLMHAAVRHMILHDDGHAWDVEKLGVPINQEDLAYTLMSFSHVVLDGLEKLDIEVNLMQAQMYLNAWRTVGRIMGIRHELIPANIPEAREFFELMKKRQLGPSEAGKVMTDAIVGLIKDVLGSFLGIFGTSLVRFFVGGRVAKMLKVRRKPLLDELVGVVAWLAAFIDGLVQSSGKGRRWFRRISMRLIQYFINQEIGTEHTREFRLPTQLHDDWKHDQPPAI